MTEIFYVELSEDALVTGADIDAVAFGTFIDMYGREVEIKEKYANEIVNNTLQAIAASRTESGELVGLPIDAAQHDKGDAAGWIVGISLDAARKIIRITPRWTEVGAELISKGIRRFFSPTIDVAKRIVLGGSLTNWPATRDPGGAVLLRPIELSASLFEIAEEEPESQTSKEKTKMDVTEEKTIIENKEESPDLLNELAQSSDDPKEFAAQIRKAAQALEDNQPDVMAKVVNDLAVKMAERRIEAANADRIRGWEVTALAAELTQGGQATALAVGLGELSTFLMSLDAEQFEAARAIFKKIANGGIVNFAERGHGRILRKKQLAVEYQAPLKETIAAGNTVDAFFAALPELGNPGDYDLSSFLQ